MIVVLLTAISPLGILNQMYSLMEINLHIVVIRSLVVSQALSTLVMVGSNSNNSHLSVLLKTRKLVVMAPLKLLHLQAMVCNRHHSVGSLLPKVISRVQS